MMRSSTFLLLHGAIATLSLMFGLGIAIFGVIYSEAHTFGEALIFFLPLLTGSSGAASVLWRQTIRHAAWVQLVLLASATGVSLCTFWVMVAISSSLLLSTLGSVMCGAICTMLALATAPIRAPAADDDVFLG